jgi:hypothetical protein
MASGQWLSLLNYSAQHGISLSTLRRRIKDNSIDFKMENGKYFILDQQPETKASAPAHKEEAFAPREIPVSNPMSSVASPFVEASVLTSANRLVEEIKAAYAKILQEKEEQIRQLKEEVVDLRMLVRIMEEQGSGRVIGQPSQTMSAPADNSPFVFGEINLKDV